MGTPTPDAAFRGSITGAYQTYLVPLIFEPYAADLVRRLASRPLTRILEVAAGTGAVTRAIAAALPRSVEIVATDLNQPMLDAAAAAGTERPVEWRRADAQQLPFEDGTFDAVVCQFGAMFFPDRPRAFSEARRVLRQGGVFLFNVWDRIEANEFADIVTRSLESFFPDDPPRFLPRVPYGYWDTSAVRRDVADGGFSAPPEIATVRERSRADSPRDPAIGFCQGTPLRNEIEARDASLLEPATDTAAEAIAGRFGRGPVEADMRAHVITVTKD